MRRLRAGFTLVELLVIVAIMAAMVTVSVLSVKAGQGVVRIKGATRDIFAVIRHARSVALVSQQPSIITYSCVTRDGEACAKIDIVSARIMSSRSRKAVETLSGEPVKSGGEELVHIEKEEGDGLEIARDEGNTVEDELFAPISEDVLTGVRIKVTRGDEVLDPDSEEGMRTRNKISVFSNVDYLLGQHDEWKKREDEKKAEEKAAAADADIDADEPEESVDQEPVSVVWEANGRCEPHRVWIYPDGARPEDGLSIRIDRFGAAKVLGGDEEDED